MTVTIIGELNKMAGEKSFPSETHCVDREISHYKPIIFLTRALIHDKNRIIIVYAHSETYKRLLRQRLTILNARRYDR